MLGLAVGDSLGIASDFHQSIRDTWVRGMLWRGSAELDEQRVARPMLPFAHSMGASSIRASDDLETAVVAARVLLECAEPSADALFAGWQKYMLGDDVWSGIAERSAIINTQRGYTPPITGNDNPAFYTDSAVASGVSIGLFCAGDTARAAAIATDYASITHAEDGIWATAAMAVAIAALANGTALHEALALAEEQIPATSWLGANVARAREITDAGTGAFASIPALSSALNSREYSHGGVAPETLPLAFSIVRLCDGRLSEALLLSLAFGRKSDSLPAMVGAIVGALDPSELLGTSWERELDAVKGLFVPAIAGSSVLELARGLSDAR
jgi:ADP-ribosylglycohydrolase